MARWGVVSAVFLCAVAFPISAFAGLPPNTPICSLQVNPTSGGSPLTVDTTGSNCFEFDSQNQPVPLTTSISWGDQTPDTPGSVATHTFVNGGDYTVTLRGTDAQNQTATASQLVTVFGPSCTLTVTPTTGAAPLTVTATGNCQNSLEDTLDWGDGTIDVDSSSGTHTYSQPGTYTVTVSGIDDSQNTGRASKDVVVTTNSPPTCTLAVNPNTGPAPLIVAATGDCTDPDNDIVFTSLNWGDGTVQTNTTSGTHTYTTAGTIPLLSPLTTVLKIMDVRRSRLWLHHQISRPRALSPSHPAAALRHSWLLRPAIAPIRKANSLPLPWTGVMAPPKPRPAALILTPRRRPTPPSSWEPTTAA